MIDFITKSVNSHLLAINTSVSRFFSELKTRILIFLADAGILISFFYVMDEVSYFHSMSEVDECGRHEGTVT